MKVKDIINKANDDLIIGLSYLMDKSKSYLYLNPESQLTSDVEEKILSIEEDLINGIPLQYALGYWEFLNISLKVDKRALIPRFETEIIVDYIIKSDLKKDKILDIGSGSGAISLSLGKNLPDSQVFGVDISEDALSLCNENKDNLNLTNVNFMKSDLFDNISDTFDIIVSNPPYINEKDYLALDKRLYHEPKLALYGGKDGLYFYKKIIEQANDYLNDNAHLIFEIGYDQKDPINELLVKSDFKNIINLKDFNGFDRFIIAQKG